ncbi:hypothetical protein [Cellulomonas sp. SG140]|uniref:hypothetical protein n=1 Tax=Cellulomonas sp. SG140 TaxID=2976536 RepID=UPI0021E99A7B|nr:hypothetical protein [Cellulomonas sp. SG140]
MQQPRAHRAHLTAAKSQPPSAEYMRGFVQALSEVVDVIGELDQAVAANRRLLAGLRADLEDMRTDLSHAEALELNEALKQAELATADVVTLAQSA